MFFVAYKSMTIVFHTSNSFRIGLYIKLSFDKSVFQSIEEHIGVILKILTMKSCIISRIFFIFHVASDGIEFFLNEILI